MTRARLLLVDDDDAFRVTTAALLREDGHEVFAASGAAEAVRLLASSTFDLLLLDLRMPGLDGIRLAETLRRRGERIPILMISGYGTVEATVEALHSGVDDMLTKPVDPAVLSDRVTRLLARRPRSPLPDAGDMPSDLIGRSAAMQSVFDAIRLVAPSDATVLLTGETGTGKELVARAVHDRSSRRGQKFVAVNCAALADGLLESELFGHVAGAFTGAVRARVGLFEAAHRGTLFLDEAGDMSAAMQHRLLRVLQERELMPVGSVRAIPVDVRIIAATNRDLRAEIGAGRFREDLFYRLNVFQLRLPPLRERPGDVPLLVQQITSRTRADGLPIACSPLAMRMLDEYLWPGNVRELVAVLHNALIHSAGGPIDVHHLSPEVRDAVAGDHADEVKRYQPPREISSERDLIEAALVRAGGARARAAELLGMGRTTLWRKLKQYGWTDSEPR